MEPLYFAGMENLRVIIYEVKLRLVRYLKCKEIPGDEGYIPVPRTRQRTEIPKMRISGNLDRHGRTRLYSLFRSFDTSDREVQSDGTITERRREVHRVVALNSWGEEER